jgi:excinuclease UvrABC nuclease subunit
LGATFDASLACQFYNDEVLANRLPFSPGQDDNEFFSSLPSAPAVFLVRSEAQGTDPYISKTANLRRRLVRLLGASDERSKKLSLRERARSIEYTLTGSDFESGFLLYDVLRTCFPKTYSARLRLRPPALIRMHMANPYPRASITRRVGRLDDLANYYGPFPSRAVAEKFANDALDFFKMRRCVDDLNPDPAFPGCIYSEMKMCLAPCFKGCSDEEYREEAERVHAFLASKGDSLVREISALRDEASTNLEFENAAAIHARMEKLKPVLTQLPEIVHRLDRLSAVIIQRSAHPESVALFRIDAGAIAGPLTFSVQQQLVPGGKSQSMESRVQEAVASIPSFLPRRAAQLMEHLAILKRWYFRGTRAGEIFFVDDQGGLPCRRIVRGIARVYRGEQPESQVSASPGNELTNPEIR